MPGVTSLYVFYQAFRDEAATEMLTGARTAEDNTLQDTLTMLTAVLGGGLFGLYMFGMLTTRGNGHDGYIHARSVFSADELALMELEFDRIVNQLRSGDEETDGTWSDSNMDPYRRANDTIWHTHNVRGRRCVFSLLYTSQFDAQPVNDRPQDRLGSNARRDRLG